VAGESSLNGVRGRKIPRFRATVGKVYVEQISETRGKKCGLREESLKHSSSTHDYGYLELPVAASLEHSELNRGGGGERVNGEKRLGRWWCVCGFKILAGD